MPKTQCDIAVGLVLPGATAPAPSLVEQISDGLSTFCGTYRWTLIHAHTGPTPRRGHCELSGPPRQVAIAVPFDGIQHVTYPWHGLPAKTAAYRAIFEQAQKDEAAVCLIVDAGQASFNPDSLDALIRPGLHSRHDLVTPVPATGRGCHLMSSHLLCPMLRSLFGSAPALPLSGTFAISPKLIRRLLARRDWTSTAARFVPELWINFTAAAEGFRRSQAHADRGIDSSHASLAPCHKAIQQIMDCLFSLMEQHEPHWLGNARVDPIEEFGKPRFESSTGTKTDGLEYLVPFIQAHSALRGEWAALLDLHTAKAIDGFASALQSGDTGAYLPDPAWVRVIYELASHWKHRRLPRHQITALLVPLYWARIGSFLMKHQWAQQSEIEHQFGLTASYFEALRPVLTERWMGRMSNRVEAA